MLNWGHFPVGGPFPTSDGYLCLIGAFRPNPCVSCAQSSDWRTSHAILDSETTSRESKNGEEMKTLLAEGSRCRTTTEWPRELDVIDFLCGPVYSLEEALADPQVRTIRW